MAKQKKTGFGTYLRHLSSILTSRPPKPACLHSCSFMSITVPVFSI